MTYIQATIGKEKYTTHIKSVTNELIADEALAVGGKGAGFNPHELLAASLAACTCITLRMYLERKNWVVENIDVEISIKKDTHLDVTVFERTILFNGQLSGDQKNKLLEIADHCPIHKILTKTIRINTLIK